MKEWKRSMKDMVQRKEFIFSLSLSVCFVLIPLFIDLFSFYQMDTLSLKPAWFCWGVNGTGYRAGKHSGTIALTPHMLQYFNAFALPLVAPMAYAYGYFDDAKSGVVKFLIPRTGRKAYYLSNACTVFLGAFLILFFPLILEQLILFLVCPVDTPYIMSSSSAADDYAAVFGAGAPLTALQLNQPYLLNLLYCVIPAATGGLMALLSYSLSLFLRKSRFLVLTLPGLLWIVVDFGIASVAGLHRFTFNQLVQPRGTFPAWAAFAVVLLFLDIALIWGKLAFAKDELS